MNFEQTTIFDFIEDNETNNKDYEWLLIDRIDKIRAINKQYDLENNAYISFSGGKDSTILHYLVDLALPNNKIPRVFINTGIEYNDIVDFVKQLSSIDTRFVILNPFKNIKETLEEYGYPFKSKQHSHNVSIYQRNKESVDKILNQKIKSYDDLETGVKSVYKYYHGIRYNSKTNNIYELPNFSCPQILKYQFSKNFTLKLSEQCCYKLKKEPIAKWEKENHRTITITGMRKSEGGNRTNLSCIITDNNKKVVKFHPLSVVDDNWCNTFVIKQNIRLCKLYYYPFNFKRTGCKGCPFSLKLQEQLDKMEEYLPKEKEQCERIWKPVYEEYRRLRYRLKK